MRKALILVIFFFLVCLLPGNIYATSTRGCSYNVNGQEIYYDTGTTYTNNPFCKPIRFTGDLLTDGLTIGIALLVLLVLIYVYKKTIGKQIDKMVAKDNTYSNRKTK